jgi:hypothetical protein
MVDGIAVVSLLEDPEPDDVRVRRLLDASSE